MGKDVKDQTNLVRRDAVYYFRARVPKDLQGHYGKAAHYYSLHTKNKAGAAELARLHRLKFDQEYAHLRALRNAALVHELSPAELERLASLYYAKMLADDEDIRARGLLMLPVPGYTGDEVFNLYGKASEGFARRDGERLARGDLKLPDADMDAFMDLHGIKLDPASEVYRKAAYAFTRERRRAGDAIAARHRGEPVDTPPAAAEAVIRSPSVPHREDTLDALLAYWKTQGTKRPRTLMEADTVIKRLRKITGEGLPASRVEKRHIVEYKDSRLAEGKHANTVKKETNLLHAIFQAAVDNARLPANPAHGIKLPKPKVSEKPRVPFGRNDLNALFRSPVYVAGLRPIGGAGEAAYWLPLIGLFTGARLEEIGQLETDDVRRERDIWFFHFAPEGATDAPSGKHQKTTSSRRRVPLHPELFRLGFLDYVASMQKAGQRKLFPRLRSAEGRQRTASFSQWFGRYIGKLGITDSRLVFHSSRHGFKDACRESGIPLEHHERFTGHANRSVGDSYGGDHFPLAPLAESMAKLHYDGLDLSHLYKHPEATPEGGTQAEP